MLLDSVNDRKQDDVALRRSIVSADPSRYLPVLFPETSGPPRDLEDVTDEDLEDTEGQWDMPEIDPREAERILEELMSQTEGSITLDEADNFDVDKDW